MIKKLFVLLLLAVAGPLFFTSTTSAINGLAGSTGNVGPDPGTYGPPGNRMNFLVSKDEYSDVSTTNIAIYSTSSTITVYIVGADVCRNAYTIGGTQDNVIDQQLNGAANGSQMVSYQLTGDSTTSVPGVLRSSADCAAAQSASNQWPATAGGARAVTTQKMIMTSGNQAAGQYYKYALKASVAGAGSICSTVKCFSNQFRVVVFEGNDAGADAGGAGTVVSQDISAGAPGFGVQASPRADGGYTDFNTYFAGDCSVGTTDVIKQIQLYDDDNSGNSAAQPNGKPFYMKIERTARTSPNWGAPESALGTITNINSDNTKGAFTNAKVNFRGSQWLNLSNEQSQRTIKIKFKMNSTYSYRVSIARIYNGNVIQVMAPFDTVWTDVNCDAGNSQVTVNSVMTNRDDAADINRSDNFTKSGSVSGFPAVQDWGYTETASKRGVFSGVQSYKVDYDANKLMQTTGNVQKLCAQGSFHVNLSDCPANNSGKRYWECYANPTGADEGNAAACSAYNFKCAYAGLPDRDYGVQYWFSAPSCNVKELGCKDGQGKDEPTGTLVWGDDVNAANFCHNKSNCPDPSQTPSDYGPNGVNMNCKIFFCAYNANTVANQYYVANPGPELTASGNRQQDIPCSKRCDNGAATYPAPLQDIGDLNCYKPPAFSVRCAWIDPASSGFDDAFVTSNGAACVGAPNQYTKGTLIGSQLCATTESDEISGWANGGGYLPPGYGGGSGSNPYRKTWTIVHGPSASACVTLGAKPYFSVLGGDIAAGPGFGGNCVSGTADIIGSNSDAAPYNGSGSQLAALALTNIKSFVTGKVQPGNTGTTWVDSIAGGSSPSELALSNDPASVAIGSGYYGGNYGQANWCVPDYYSNVDETAPGVDTTLNGNNTPTAQLSNTNQVYFVNGDLSIMGSNDIPANGQKTIIKVNGDVYIKKSITYASAGTDVTKIPQLQIIASGSIYVDNSVTQLDGFYAAQGSKLNSAGLFVTCSDAAGQILQSSATCGNQLRINGGVATKQLILNRARGDRDGRYSQPEEPAEIITFSPQFWLPNSTESNSVGAWQSVTSLPPIL